MSLITQFITFGNSIVFVLGVAVGAAVAFLYAKAHPVGATHIESDISAEVAKLQSTATSTVATQVKTVVSDVEAAVTKTPPST